MRFLGVVTLAFAFLAVGTGPAEAHAGGTTGFAAVTVDGQTVRYSLTLSPEALERAKADPALTDRIRSAGHDGLANLVARHLTISAD